MIAANDNYYSLAAAAAKMGITSRALAKTGKRLGLCSVFGRDIRFSESDLTGIWEATSLERENERFKTAQLRDARKTALYRHFDKNGALLYVGISLNALDRLAAHVATSEWAHEIATIKIEYFDSRELALIAERKAIISKKPRFNIKHNLVAANNRSNTARAA